MKFWKIFALASFVMLAGPATAGTDGGPQALSTSSLHIESGTSQNAMIQDPYSYLLPSDVDSANLELSQGYSINLKPLYADDMSRYQMKVTNSQDMGAGYASPYLWEAGSGPGFRPTQGNWSPVQDGRAFSPIPMPGR